MIRRAKSSAGTATADDESSIKHKKTGNTTQLEFPSPFFPITVAQQQLPLKDEDDQRDYLGLVESHTDSARSAKNAMETRHQAVESEDNVASPGYVPYVAGARYLTSDVAGCIYARDRTQSNIEREVTKIFMQHHATSQDVTMTSLAAFLQDLSPEGTRRFSSKAEDVLSYAWILSASDTGMSIRRLEALTRASAPGGSQSVSLWIVLQLLRVERIDAPALAILLSWFLNNYKQFQWRGETAMLLTSRMMRHARASAPFLMESITILFIQLLGVVFHPNGSLSGRELLQKITQWTNRIISILRLPSKIHPFRTMIFQQEAQLILVRYMQAHKPVLHMNREAYQAIAAVQAMHRKTADEAGWANAKSLRWPPWEERNAMGAKIKPEVYPGKYSRAEQVLQQMEKSGYARQDSDLALQIIAGWDDDRTPTIQTRRSSNYFYLYPSKKDDGSSLIWAARIDSTRTKMEAWMCFCNYTASVKPEAQAADVYHVMFIKLQAKLVQRSAALPGDGLEVYRDPEPIRDRVYVPEHVPKPAELFSRMIRNGIEPTLRLLADLLVRDSKLDRALDYLTHAPIAVDSRIILCRPMEHDHEEVAAALKSLPVFFCRAYIKLLARPHTLLRKPLYTFGLKGAQRSRGFEFAAKILGSLGAVDGSIWTAYFVGLLLHGVVGSSQVQKSRLSNVWIIACKTLACNQWPVYLSSGAVEAICRLAYVVETSPRKDGPWDIIETDPEMNPVQTAKKAFMLAATGKEGTFAATNKHQILCHIPKGEAIEALVWVLGTAQNESSVQDTLQLLRWTHHHRHQLRKHNLVPTKHNLAAFRAFLTGSWAIGEDDLLDEVHVASTEQVEEAQALVDEIAGWPSDEDMTKYLDEQHGQFARIKKRLRVKMTERRKLSRRKKAS